MSPGKAEDIFRKVLVVVHKNQASRRGIKSRLLVTRSNAAVTLFRTHGGKPDENCPPVQVITSTYSTTIELLTNFDVDCACFTWLPIEGKVVCTARGLRALRYGVNIADNGRFDSPAYCRRLEKYADRGFAVAVPGR